MFVDIASLEYSHIENNSFLIEIIMKILYAKEYSLKFINSRMEIQTEKNWWKWE